MNEIQIVLTTDNRLHSRLARWLGATWTHAMLRYENIGHPFSVRMGLDSPYYIIEASMRHGVVERPWNPEEYTKWAVYRLKEPLSEERAGCLLAYARGNIGKRYAYEKLALLLPRFIREATSRHTARWDAELYRFTILGSGQVCTSLVDDCFLQGAHIDLVPDTDTPWVLPDDIAEGPLLEKIEEGSLVLTRWRKVKATPKIVDDEILIDP